MYSHCTDHASRMHVCIGSRLSCVPKIGHPSTRHVSTCASQHTEHQHNFSFTYLSSSPNPDLLSTHPFIHCEDPRRDGTSTEFHSSTHSRLRATLIDHVKIGSVTGIEVFTCAVTLVFQVQVPSRHPEQVKFHVRISRGVQQYARQFIPERTEHQLRATACTDAR